MSIFLLFFTTLVLLAHCCLGFLPGANHPGSSRHIRLAEISTQESDLDITYRSPTAEDIAQCFVIESASYPADEAATLESLHYRQANAGEYFQCAILNGKEIIGFVCATRCQDFQEESMSTHDPSGSLLAIHSVVVAEKYRRKGIAAAMLKAYLQKVKSGNIANANPVISSIVLLAKAHLLGFYVKCGFQVNRPSPIVHGQELWYELEQRLLQTQPGDNEKWYCKTQRFKKSIGLEAHKAWVESLRQHGVCITSGYNVGEDCSPTSGLLFVAAKSYEEALNIVNKDPLVMKDGMDWELNEWVGEILIR